MAIQIPSPMGERNTRRANLISEELNSDNQKVNKVNQPYMVNLTNNETLILQTVPQELDINPNTQWAVLASLGRNNPGYQYMGSEDTVAFTLSLYSDEEHKEDVLKTVKTIEAWSKADGYISGPPMIQLVWGAMFKDSRFIIFACPYRLGLFDREKSMLPCQAVIDITLKKVIQENPEHYKIRKLST